MASPTQVTQDIQDRILGTVQVGQKAVLDFVRSWAETVEATFSQLPELTFSDPAARPGQGFEGAFAFTERLLASQRDFANQLFEASIPASRAAPRAAQTAASKAANR
jgi:hypothetical protein